MPQNEGPPFCINGMTLTLRTLVSAGGLQALVSKMYRQAGEGLYAMFSSGFYQAAAWLFIGTAVLFAGAIIDNFVLTEAEGQG